MAIFKGVRTKNGAFVTYDDAPLDLRLDLKSHSPMGFEWGYNGSGAMQLALAMISQFSANKLIFNHYEEFMKEFIQPIEADEWSIDDSILIAWLQVNKIVSILTPRFKILDKFMYLDNNKFGFGFDESKEESVYYCNFFDISDLNVNELPANIIFDFNDSDDSKCSSIDGFHFDRLIRDNDEVIVDFFWYIDVMEYINSNKPMFTNDKLISRLSEITDIQIRKEHFDDGNHFIDLSIINNDLSRNIKFFVEEKIYEISNVVNGLKTSVKFDNFEAVFNFPKEYQSVLKQYMLYFEEFLNDLCIESNVSIQNVGLETILSVEPTNRDEALEKIADALKMYISAPILASDVSLEEKLEMQTALQKLHATCSHLESQQLLKSVTLKEQTNQLIIQDKIIDETKNILIDLGIKAETLNGNNMMLLDSLKELRYDKKVDNKKTFLSSFKTSIKFFEGFQASLEIGRRQLKDKDE